MASSEVIFGGFQLLGTTVAPVDCPFFLLSILQLQPSKAALLAYYTEK